jgi:hypothetical protein
LVSLNRTDIVQPSGSSAISLAVDQRARYAPEPFDPTAVGAFTHNTTGINTVIGATLSSTHFPGSATIMTSADLVAACSTMMDEVNSNRLLINRIAYILEANGMTS